MINIGLDIMGGDLAPLATLEGTLASLSHLGTDTQLHLIGPSEVILSFFKEKGIPVPDNIQISEATEVIEMGEHPVKALQSKPHASLNVGFSMLASGQLDGLASAGNSGAVMVASLNALKSIPGVSRPCVMGAFPQLNGSYNVVLDVGINVDVKPELLVQFAKLGVIYSKQVFGVSNPRVGLLNTGEEPTKGSLLYQKTHELLSNSKEFTFTGNIEARELYDDRVDVVVCDGFTGNVLLKQAEGFYHLIQQRNIHDSLLEKFNYELYGGTPILGVQGNVILGHGVSSARAISNMILATEKIAKAKLSDHITKAFN